MSPPLTELAELRPSSDRWSAATPGARRSQPARSAKGSDSSFDGSARKPSMLVLEGSLADGSGADMNDPAAIAIGSPASEKNSIPATKTDRPVFTVLPTPRTTPEPGAGR